MNPHDRPREKLLKRGPQGLRDEELLALILRTGRKGQNVIELAETVVKQLPDKGETPTIQKLLLIPGIDIAKACMVIAILELGKRWYGERNVTIPTVESPGDVLALLTGIRRVQKEHFVAVYLNARNQVIHFETVSIGTLNASLVHPREVFEPAIRHVASSVVLSHNHPSGDPQPSDADVRVTERLVEAGKLMGIEIMDHVIVTESKYYSFREAGKI